MTDLGTHVILDLDGCPELLLADTVEIRRKLKQAAERAGATIVGEAFHEFDPPGVSGVLLIAESHLSVHTWPSLGRAALDVYTCGKKFDAIRAADLLVRSLGARRQRRVVVHRGFASEARTQPIA